VAQPGSALAWGARGRGFKSRRSDMEIKTRKKTILVGDKVLVAPDRDQDRTAHGLYLPPGVKEREKTQSGIVVQVGPGYAVANPNFIEQEPWATTPKEPVKYIPLQAEEGDHAMFLRDSAFEIEYDGEKYLIVPHASILMLIRRDSFTGIDR
jgi:chaperonin GroES